MHPATSRTSIDILLPSEPEQDVYQKDLLPSLRKRGGGSNMPLQVVLPLIRVRKTQAK